MKYCSTQPTTMNKYNLISFQFKSDKVKPSLCPNITKIPEILNDSAIQVDNLMWGLKEGPLPSILA